MSYLNANIPVEYAQIRREYLYDLKKHHGEVEDCIIFGLSSIAPNTLSAKIATCISLPGMYSSIKI